MGTELTLQINSKLELMGSVEQAILDEAAQIGFDEDCCFALRLAMDEALVNAIIHGNKNQETKVVRVKAVFENDKISVSIQDEGSGFDRSKLYDPRQEPFLHQTHGRGVFLIRQFASDVFFNESGNQITFVVDQNKPAPILQTT